MQLDLRKLPPHLLEATRKGYLVPFIGAGISKLAKTFGPSLLPNWSELLHQILNLAMVDINFDRTFVSVIQELINKGDYLVAAQLLKDKIDPGLFEHFIRMRFLTGVEPSAIHCLLFELERL